MGKEQEETLASIKELQQMEKDMYELETASVSGEDLNRV